MAWRHGGRVISLKKADQDRIYWQQLIKGAASKRITFKERFSGGFKNRCKGKSEDVF